MLPDVELTVVANVGDDTEVHGLLVCPDLDALLYTLAGLLDTERGWGLRGDTHTAHAMWERLGEPTWFTVGDALLFGMKRCPPCTHLERLTGVRLVKAMVDRGGINAAVFAGGPITEGAVLRHVSEAEAARRGAPTGGDRPVPRAV